jgi:hypothetical protein
MIVYKYQIVFGSRHTVSMPRGARILRFNNQDGVPCIWALVDPHEVAEERKFLLVNTGEPFNALGLTYVGSALFSGGSLVWHLFEKEAA